MHSTNRHGFIFCVAMKARLSKNEHLCLCLLSYCNVGTCVLPAVEYFTQSLLFFDSCEKEVVADDLKTIFFFSLFGSHSMFVFTLGNHQSVKFQKLQYPFSCTFCSFLTMFYAEEFTK